MQESKWKSRSEINAPVCLRRRNLVFSTGGGGAQRGVSFANIRSFKIIYPSMYGITSGLLVAGCLECHLQDRALGLARGNEAILYATASKV
jgi:hypothetical protein